MMGGTPLSLRRRSTPPVPIQGSCSLQHSSLMVSSNVEVPQTHFRQSDLDHIFFFTFFLTSTQSHFFTFLFVLVTLMRL